MNSELRCVHRVLCAFLQSLMDSEFHVADLEMPGFMVAMQLVNKVGFLDTGL